MKSWPSVIGQWAVFLGLAAIVPAGAAEKPGTNDGGQAAKDDVQDFVFLTEARPLLIRLHVRIDGKPLHGSWDDFMKHLFAYLDVDGDGVLSKEEAERAPSIDQLLGAVSAGFGGMGGRAQAAPSMEDLDADKDGKVTLAELSAYYRKKGFTPFRFRLSSGQANPLGGAAAFLGGGQPEPSAKQVGDAIFNLLDTNKDGKLTKEKLAAAPAVLLQLDEDEDEMIVPRELVPNAAGSGDQLGAMMRLGRPGNQGAAAGSKVLMLIATPGETPAELVRNLQERYGPKAVKPADKKLSQKDLGLDDALFRKLDVNGDGVLDAEELAGFVKRDPDLEMTIHLGEKGAALPRIALVTGQGRSPLADKFQLKDPFAQLDLGVARVDLKTSGDNRPDALGGILQQQYLAQFKRADSDNSGFLDATKAQASPLFRNQFKAMDRQGKGKVSEKDLLAYLDRLQDLQKQAKAACVTLELSDQSRGLFDVLDTNRDGRLSVREMRGAVKLLEQLDRERKGYFTRDDVPRCYQLTLHPGASAAGGLGGAGAFLDLYRGSARTEAEAVGRGPLWFRKMDRNRDGDVSRKEWLWSEELFRQIDTDGDGLISLEEAERYDALLRKKK